MSRQKVKEEKSMYDIVIIQESENMYSWALRQVAPYKVLAVSQLIAEKYLIEIEAQQIADKFGLSVFVEEN